jgi:anaerobic sulfite reductase subunit A
MGYNLTREAFDGVLSKLAERYHIFAPKRFEMGGHFSDTDLIRYGHVTAAAEIVFGEKSAQSFKEALLPITQVLFYFTEKEIKESDSPEKDMLVFLRSCDLAAVQRLDAIYLHNGEPDYYYKRVRDKIRFALIGCPEAFENCFCVDMETNRSENYDFAITERDGVYCLDCKAEDIGTLVKTAGEAVEDIPAFFVTETKTRVAIPANLNAAVAKASLWEEYDSRCINCGRCNFVCPTCTCNSMQDIFYTENGKAGERRRVWASCMVDGFTDVAGGGSYRQKNGQRMRFKTLHKVLDYRQRFGENMCVGCGRCDDVCPEYIRFSHIINRLGEAMEEVEGSAN